MPSERRSTVVLLKAGKGVVSQEGIGSVPKNVIENLLGTSSKPRSATRASAKLKSRSGSPVSAAISS